MEKQETEFPIVTMLPGNNTEVELPEEMIFGSGHVVSIVTYSVLMVISAIGNISVLVILLRTKKQSRINLMLIHLAVADLLVTFLMMPLEIAWAATVSWRAGDSMCRIMAFFRIFGLYLSSFVLVCITVDRYIAVLKPMSLDNDRRVKIMLMSAWIFSVFCSMPQSVVFHVETHQSITWFKQCVTFNFFPSFSHELVYLVFGMTMMYFMPLLVILFSYVSILVEIYRRSRQPIDDTFRRSSIGYLGKAKIRTLKMTVLIVAVFVVCWTPYHVMCVWYWIDKVSAMKVDMRIQKALFLFASTNSCMNPIVYGIFHIRSRRNQSASEGQVRERLNTFSSTVPAEWSPKSIRKKRPSIQSIQNIEKENGFNLQSLRLKSFAKGSITEVTSTAM